IRETPGSGTPIGTLTLNETVESMESKDETVRKLGVLNEWLRVKSDDGTVGYVAAWFMGDPDAPGTPSAHIAPDGRVTPPDPTAPPDAVTPARPTTPPAPITSSTAYVRPKEDGLRIRKLPRDGRPI